MPNSSYGPQGIIAGMSFGAGGVGGGTYLYPDYKLVEEKIQEWDWFRRFLEQNPDVAERYEVHKTYEILNDTQN
jgi:hypothetical protein